MTFEEKVAMWSEKKKIYRSTDGVFQTKPLVPTIREDLCMKYQKEIGG